MQLRTDIYACIVSHLFICLLFIYNKNANIFKTNIETSSHKYVIKYMYNTYQVEKSVDASVRISLRRLVAGGTWGKITGANTPQIPQHCPACCDSYFLK